MPYVIERWPGGMLTNFPTIRKAVKKMSTIDKLIADGTYSNLSKRELLQVTRQRAKLEKNLGSISDLTRLPSALFVVDVMKEHIAVADGGLRYTMCLLDKYIQEIKKMQADGVDVLPILTKADAADALNHKAATLLAIEEGGAIDGSLEALRCLYELGLIFFSDFVLLLNLCMMGGIP